MGRRSGVIEPLGALAAAASIVAVLLGGSLPCSAQSAGPGLGRFELGVGAAYFPSYVVSHDDARQWALDVAGRLVASRRGGVELAYAYVPQSSAGYAPRLHAFRAVAVGSVPFEGSGSTELSGGLGLAALVVRAPTIDCGEFPLCSEWAPRSGTKIALVAKAGVTVGLTERLGVFADLHLFRPSGDEWSAAGDPEWISEVALGLRVRLGGARTRFPEA